MPALKTFKTIPDLYNHLVEEHGPTAERSAFRHKVDGVYTDISFKQFKQETESFAMGLASLGVKRGDKVAIIGENTRMGIFRYGHHGFGRSRCSVVSNINF